MIDVGLIVSRQHLCRRRCRLRASYPTRQWSYVDVSSSPMYRYARSQRRMYTEAVLMACVPLPFGRRSVAGISLFR